MLRKKHSGNEPNTKKQIKKPKTITKTPQTHYSPESTYYTNPGKTTKANPEGE